MAWLEYSLMRMRSSDGVGGSTWILDFCNRYHTTAHNIPFPSPDSFGTSGARATKSFSLAQACSRPLPILNATNQPDIPEHSCSSFGWQAPRCTRDKGSDNTASGTNRLVHVLLVFQSHRRRTLLSLTHTFET